MLGVAQSAIYLIVLLICSNGVSSIMWYVKAVEVRQLRAEIAADDTKDKLQTAELQLENARETIVRNDAILIKVAAQENEINRLTEEKNDALRKTTVGRRCLDAAAVGVLNGTAVPKPVTSSVSTDAAFATDTDVGLWAASCKRSYDTCRARIDGIADFYGEPK
jgi:hypothetical protein